MKFDYSTKNHPVCPKPRRPISSIPEVLNPLVRCSKHRHSYVPYSSARNGTLNIIDEKSSEYSTCCGCSQLYYPGSPPGRTDNPLIHDVQFRSQWSSFPHHSQTNLSDKFGYASISPS
ncbi:hypothetical protein Droror1_Dr00010961 [Drosera rotundifolia]